MKISVLMACYNPNKEYINLSIKSILNQTYSNFELIIVDDGSKKSVQETLNECNINDKRIKIITSRENLGLAKALNLGLAKCTGEYIARMDDDDIAFKERLEKQLNYVISNEVSGCWSGYNRISNYGEIINEVNIRLDSKKYLDTIVGKGNIFVHSTLFIKKSVLNSINGYDENLRYAQDSDLYIRILEKYKMGYVEEILVNFRVNQLKQNLYKDCFSSVCSLFGAYYFYLRNYQNFHYRIIFYKRIFRFIISSIILYPIRNKKSNRGLK